MPARVPSQPQVVPRTPFSLPRTDMHAPPFLERHHGAEAPDLDTQLENSNRLGHHFDQIPVSRSSSSPQHGLPDPLRVGLERLSGMDLSDVRVHYGSSEPTRMQAFASTRSNAIHLAPGQEHHLAHEGWHVVQQRQGRVRATAQVQGSALNDDPSLEREADVMGAKASSSSLPASAGVAPIATSTPPASGGATGSVGQLQGWGRRAAAAYTGFVGHNLWRQYDIQRNPQSYLGGPNEEVGRLRAVHETRRSGTGSVGRAMYPPVATFHALMGNIGSSTIGQHYARDIPDMLAAPDTDENLFNVARHETDNYWNQQPGLAGRMGGALNADQRARVLRLSRFFSSRDR
ncbi:DUF4157 domain-containing protein [Corallococcus sp. AB004]|nr:DUF4157 domain-containing protein [Corallococcus sp. AB004]